MIVEKTTVRMTITAKNQNDLREQVKDHFRLVEPECTPEGKEFQYTKLELIKLLDDYQRAFPSGASLLDRKHWVEQYAR